MNPLLLLGAGIAALVVTKKPTPAATPPTPTANGGPIPLAPSAPPACNAPPAGSKPGPRIILMQRATGGGEIVLGKSTIAPDGRYYIGPSPVGMSATLGAKAPACYEMWEGPFTVPQLSSRGWMLEPEAKPGQYP